MITNQKELRALKEDELRQDVLIPLLKAMGYQDVEHWHGGPNELGKDIVGWKPGDIRREYIAIVVKAGRMSGAAGNAGTVASQINQSFNMPFRNKVTQEEHYAHMVWVACNHPISKDARTAILANIEPSKHRYVIWVDGDTLWGKWKNYMLTELHHSIEVLKQELAEVDEHYRTEVQIGPKGNPIATIDSGDLRLAIYEKHPGAAKDFPMQMRANFRFPDSPEGQTKRQEFERAMSAGEPVVLPEEYIEVDLPEILKQISERVLGVEPERVSQLEISGIRDVGHILARLDIESNDGGHEVLEYLDLQIKHRGTDQLTLANDSQPIPIKFLIVIDFKGKSAKLTIGRKDGPVTVIWLLRMLKLQQCIRKPGTARLSLIDTGVTLAEINIEGSKDAAEVEGLDGLADLVRIQQKVGRPIYLPERELTDEERSTIGLLRDILHNPTRKRSWKNATIAIAVHASEAERYLQAYAQGRTAMLTIEQEASLSLFGTQLPLGIIRRVCSQARLENEAEVQEILAKNTDSRASVPLRFVAGEDDTIDVQYINWSG